MPVCIPTLILCNDRLFSPQSVGNQKDVGEKSGGQKRELE